MTNEWKKDKYLLFLMCALLMAVYLKTQDSTVATLLVTCVGGFLTLITKSATTSATTGSGDVNVSQPPSVNNKDKNITG